MYYGSLRDCRNRCDSVLQSQSHFEASAKKYLHWRDRDIRIREFGDLDGRCLRAAAQQLITQHVGHVASSTPGRWKTGSDAYVDANFAALSRVTRLHANQCAALSFLKCPAALLSLSQLRELSVGLQLMCGDELMPLSGAHPSLYTAMYQALQASFCSLPWPSDCLMES